MPDAISLFPDPAARLGFVAVSLGFMALEYGASRLLHRAPETHDVGETAASFGLAVGQNVLRFALAGATAAVLTTVYQVRLLDFDQGTPLAIAALFFTSEFVYYWHHRISHRVRWFWANHSVHHSATRLNLTAAIRLGWTGSISGHVLFLAPLVLIGFHPLAVLAAIGANLLYQFFIHSQLLPRLGPLEWVLNTPTHHRVHHATNPGCLDRNYGGVLIVFDRLFGTFAEAPAGEPLRYGLVGRAPTNNPVRIAFREWVAMVRDLARAPSWRARFRVLFAPPVSTGSAPSDTASAESPPAPRAVPKSPLIAGE